MKITKKEEKELEAWALKFFEMGWDAAYTCINSMDALGKKCKLNAMEEYIAKFSEQLDTSSS